MKQHKIYKIRHIPTGLYFESNVDFDKTNLSPIGRIFIRLPKHPKHARIKRLGSNKYISGHKWFNHLVENNSNNWKIITYKKLIKI